jgi:hypothetical protein
MTRSVIVVLQKLLSYLPKISESKLQKYPQLVAFSAMHRALWRAMLYGINDMSFPFMF